MAIVTYGKRPTEGGLGDGVHELPTRLEKGSPDLNVKAPVDVFGDAFTSMFGQKASAK